MSTLNQNQISVQALDKKRLLQLVSKLDQAKVLVLGDLILDEYLLGKPERISREAPVIIFKYLDSQFKLGGAANAAANLASFGCKVTLLGVVGDDPGAEAMARIAREQNIDLIAIKDSLRQTTTKTRIVSNSSSDPDAGTGVQQQVLRFDREDNHDLTADQIECILAQVADADFDLVLLSDYSNGVLDETLAQAVIKQAKVIVDSNGDLRKFKGAYSFTPNQPDTEALIGRRIKNDSDLALAATELKQTLAAEQVLITRGAKGMALLGEQSLDLIPALNLSEVFDVSGAGDTVSALYSAALAIGASPLEAALLGNLAASIVVKKYGTAVTCKEEMVELIQGL